MNKDNKLKDIANKIKELSESGVLIWKPSSRRNSYVTNIGNGSVAITKLSSNSIISNDPIELSFRNNKGEEIGLLDNSITSIENDPILKSIFNLAENSYLKVDDTLNSMIDDLYTR